MTRSTINLISTIRENESHSYVVGRETYATKQLSKNHFNELSKKEDVDMMYIGKAEKESVSIFYVDTKQGTFFISVQTELPQEPFKSINKEVSLKKLIKNCPIINHKNSDKDNDDTYLITYRMFFYIVTKLRHSVFSYSDDFKYCLLDLYIDNSIVHVAVENVTY